MAAPRPTSLQIRWAMFRRSIMRAGGTADIPTLYMPRLRRCTAEYTKAGLTESQPFISRHERGVRLVQRSVKNARASDLLTADQPYRLTAAFHFAKPA